MVAVMTPGNAGVPVTTPDFADSPFALGTKLTEYVSPFPAGSLNAEPPFVASYVQATPAVLAHTSLVLNSAGAAVFAGVRLVVALSPPHAAVSSASASGHCRTQEGIAIRAFLWRSSA